MRIIQPYLFVAYCVLYRSLPTYGSTSVPMVLVDPTSVIGHDCVIAFKHPRLCLNLRLVDVNSFKRNQKRVPKHTHGRAKEWEIDPKSCLQCFGEPICINCGPLFRITTYSLGSSARQRARYYSLGRALYCIWQFVWPTEHKQGFWRPSLGVQLLIGAPLPPPLSSLMLH